MAHRGDGDARRRYEIVGSNEPDDDGPLPEDSKEARGRSAMAMQAMWLRYVFKCGTYYR